MLFFLKFQKDIQPSVLAMKPAKGENWKEGRIFTTLWR